MLNLFVHLVNILLITGLCIYIYVLFQRGYEVAYYSRESYNVNTANKKTFAENATSALLLFLLPFHEYSIQVRARTIEPGPWTDILNTRTANEGTSCLHPSLYYPLFTIQRDFLGRPVLLCFPNKVSQLL